MTIYARSKYNKEKKYIFIHEISNPFRQNIPFCGSFKPFRGSNIPVSGSFFPFGERHILYCKRLFLLMIKIL
jgi:hypothetical protein